MVLPMLSIFDSNKQKTPLEISVVLSRCTVINRAPIYLPPSCKDRGIKKSTHCTAMALSNLMVSGTTSGCPEIEA
jgi:hypothetical protein